MRINQHYSSIRNKLETPVFRHFQDIIAQSHIQLEFLFYQKIKYVDNAQKLGNTWEKIWMASSYAPPCFKILCIPKPMDKLTLNESATIKAQCHLDSWKLAKTNINAVQWEGETNCISWLYTIHQFGAESSILSSVEFLSRFRPFNYSFTQTLSVPVYQFRKQVKDAS